MKPTAVVTWILASCVLARGAAPVEAQRGRVSATIVEKGPPIDGTLASPVWRRCPPLELGECTSERPGPLKTTARVLFDAARLYVAFECAEPDTAGLRQDVTERDGRVWQEDCVEVFVTGDPRQGYFHFAVNPRGALMDARTRGRARDDTSWNSSAVVKVTVNKNKSWIVTMSVPLAELGAKPGEDQTWLLNLNRTRPLGGSQWAESSWSRNGRSDYHDSTGWGKLTRVNVP